MSKIIYICGSDPAVADGTRCTIVEMGVAVELAWDKAHAAEILENYRLQTEAIVAYYDKYRVFNPVTLGTGGNMESSEIIRSSNNIFKEVKHE